MARMLLDPETVEWAMARRGVTSYDIARELAHLGWVRTPRTVRRWRAEPTAVDPEMAHALARALGCKLKILGTPIRKEA